MESKKLSKLIKTSSASWKSSKIDKVQTISLNTDPTDRKGSFLVRVLPGGRFPKHRHPAGEEMLFLKGQATVGGHEVKAGDFLYSPPASVHALSTKEGCIFLRMISEPIQIVPEGTLEEIDEIPEMAPPAPTAGVPTSESYFPSQRIIDPESDS